jgi:undecaprenyl-diphosphatase
MKVSTSTNFSMPSSHATNVFAAAAFLSWFYPGYAWLCLVVALLVSYSRPYLGMHYPLDVAAGAVLGSAIGIMYAFLSAWILHRIKGRTVGPVSASEDGKAPGPPREDDNG